LIDPETKQHWKLHSLFGIWCGGSGDEQPLMLSREINANTMEEYLQVRATGERLQNIDPRRLFNTDEKPCVLSKIHGETIVFQDMTCPMFVPLQKRESNCTLVITSRGDGLIVSVTVILPASVKKIQPEIVAIFERHCDQEIQVTHNATGMIFIARRKKILIKCMNRIYHRRSIFISFEPHF
jgi:hypothetical protein